MLGATILLNNVCNKKCKYCYEKNDGKYILTKSNIDSIMERLSKFNQLEKDIEFFGGEPTLSLDIIKYTVEKYPDYSYRIITNGYFLELEEFEYECLSKLLSVTLSLEGTEKAFNELRNGIDLNKTLDKLIKLNRKWKNISVNLSINGILLENIDEFIHNYELLISNNIGVHFYSLKDENFFNEKDFLYFLMYIKDKNEKLYNEIILNDNNKSDTEFLCSLNDRIVINSKMEIIECAWINKKISDLSCSNEEILYSFAEGISKNHKSLFGGCNECEVEIGKCSISCRAFIEECLKNNKIELLNRLCNQERIKEYLRREENVEG